MLISPEGRSVGLCLAGAAQSSPVENWDGVNEGFSWQPLCLMGAVCAWCHWLIYSPQERRIDLSQPSAAGEQEGRNG